MKNYHYYLKQELFSTSSGRFSNVSWHPEQPMTLYLVEQGESLPARRADRLGCIQVRQFVWDTYAAHLPMPNDTASVAVVDGRNLLITPFRTQNTPPPMASYTIALPATPIHVAMSDITDSLSVLYRNGLVQVWDLNTRVPDRKGSKLRGGGKVAEPKIAWEQTAQMDGLVGMSLAIGQEGQVAVLASGAGKTHIVTLANGQENAVQEADANVERLLFSSDGRLLSLNKAGAFRIGEYSSLILDLADMTANDPDSEAQLCPNAQAVSVSQGSELIFALSSNGKLLFAPLSLPDLIDATPLASAVTSFTLTPEFLIYTTTAQNSHYAPMSVLRRLALGEDVSSAEQEWETRRIGSGCLPK
jgi:elongator complex protein 1